jgi:ribA/ribD-fused uncharacterized protein
MVVAEAPPPITSFTGRWAFLSNFSKAPVIMGTQVYPTVEHAFQAAKTLDPSVRRRIAQMPTPGRAKALGQRVDLRADWEQIKFTVMLRLLRQKFKGKRALDLLSTEDRYLEEGNTWGDRVWGVYQGHGDNLLGRLLMQVRGELRGEFHCTFCGSDDPKHAHVWEAPR